MGLKNCQIQLDNPWNTYYAGQTINGQVILTFDSPKKVRGIRLKAYGKSQTYLLGQRFYLRGMEKFKVAKIYILGDEDENEIQISEGTHTYNFQVKLPDDLPSSFEGSKGFIQYMCKIDFCDAWTNIEKEFKIASHIDLNLDPSLNNEFTKKMQKRFYSFLTVCTGPLKFDVHLPVTGFIPTEKIPINATCVNRSGISVRSIKVVLRQCNNYYLPHDNSQLSFETEKLNEIDIGSVGPKETKDFSAELEIPAFQPISTVKSKYIFVHYELLFRLIVSPIHRDLRGRIRIVIGTVPFNPNFQPQIGFEPKVLQDKPRENCCTRNYECCDHY